MLIPKWRLLFANLNRVIPQGSLDDIRATFNKVAVWCPQLPQCSVRKTGTFPIQNCFENESPPVKGTAMGKQVVKKEAQSRFWIVFGCRSIWDVCYFIIVMAGYAYWGHGQYYRSLSGPVPPVSFVINISSLSYRSSPTYRRSLSPNSEFQKIYIKNPNFGIVEFLKYTEPGVLLIS